MTRLHLRFASRKAAVGTIAVFAAVLLGACGPTPSLSLTLEAPATEVLLGGSREINVTLSRVAGAAGEATLDADGAPAWVTVTFEPATLGGDTLASTMTIQTDADHADAAATEFSLDVSAVARGLSAHETLAVSVELLTVNGTLSDPLGAPISGASVTVAGRPAVTTDAVGAFAVENVVIPYDLTVVEPVENWGHVYQGLSTTDLLLASLSGGLTPTPTGAATVSGDLAVAVSTDQLVLVCVEGVVKPVAGSCEQISPGDTAYSSDVTWYEGATADVRVRAWLFDLGVDSMLIGVLGSAQVEAELVDTVAEVVDLTMGAAPATTSVELEVTPPPGVPLTAVALLWHYGQHATAVIPFSTATGAYSAVIPDYPDATHSAMALAAPGGVQVTVWQHGDFGGQQLSIEMPAPAVQLAPSDGATDVTTDTVFSAINPGDYPLTFGFESNTGPNLYVTTMSNETTIPDLSALGLALPPAASYSWGVFGAPSRATVDETVLNSNWIVDFVALSKAIQGWPTNGNSGELVFNGARNFTTE